MGVSGFVVQLLNGLAGASSLFLVAAGLSLIFGVTRIVNFAHGTFYMLGVYLAYTAVDRLAPTVGYWGALALAALAVGALGAVVELALLRRIYRAPELFQLLATFALALVLTVPVLHEHLRVSLNSRTGAGGGNRHQDHAPRSDGLGRYRRRRRPVNRR